MQIEDAFFNVSDYEILNNKVIGEGACGKVYLARNKKNKKIYAAKILNTSSGFDGLQQMQFLRESLILHSINHPSIIKFQGLNFRSILDSSKLDPTIITEYLSHGSLKDNLDKERSTEPDKNWTMTKKYIILLGVSDAMRYLHEHEIIHRDLKSQNILIDENYYPRICDFGLSRFLPKFEDLEMTNGIGTPLYMAPELLDDNEDTTYNQSIDVYAFGIIIYEVISGKQPFSELGKLNKFRFSVKIIKGYRPQLTDKITDKMKELISRCWSKNVDDRPSFKEIYEKLSSDFSYFNKGEIDEGEIKKFIKILDEERRKEEEKEKKLNKVKIVTHDDVDDDDNGYEQTAILKDRNSVKFELHEKTKIAEVVESYSVEGDVIIPSFIKFGSTKYDVIKISNKAFAGSLIKSLSFQPDSSFKIIGNSAFENTKIHKIFIPRSLTKLEKFWCKGADELNEIEIDPNNLFFSNKNGFLTYKNETTSQILFASREFKGDFLIPEETTKIGEFSFANRKGLQSIKSKTSMLRSIGSFSFLGCENLTHVVINQETSLTLFEFCFSNCRKLSSFEVSCKMLEIQNDCFNDCTSLSFFKVMKSETIKIHQNSFKNCTNLSEISFNNSYEIQIENDHFTYSRKLKSISFNEVNKINLGKKAFKYFNSLETFSITKSSEVLIGDECLSELANLKTLRIISDKITFGEDFVSKCNSLTDVDIQTKSDIIIASSTFKSSDLNKVILHSPKLKLFSSCFEGFTNLKTIELESDIFEIYYECFNQCQSLSTFMLKANEISMENYTFTGCDSIKKLSLEAKSKLTIPNEFMKGSTNLEHINMSGDQIILGDFCFKDCIALKTFTIIESDSILLGNQLFANATSLENVRIKLDKKSKIDLNSNYFNGAINLKEFYLTGGDVTISNDCFKLCTSLNLLFILKTSKISISENQFSNMKSLQKVIIESDSEIDIGSGCFSGSEKLEFAKIVGKNVSLSNNCFMNCKSISNIIIDGASNIKLGTGIFNNCNKLISIVLNASSSLAFLEKCFNGSKLETIDIKGPKVEIENECFSNCYSLQQLKIENVKDLTIGSNAFNKCNKITNFIFNASSSLTFLEKCFNGSSFETIEINSQKVKIENECFSNCYSLQQLKMENVKDLTIGSNAFNKCNKITNFSFNASSSLTFLEKCFNGSSFEAIEINSQKVEIKNECFLNCSSLKQFKIGKVIDLNLGSNVFYGCTKLERIDFDISKSLTIGDDCFRFSSVKDVALLAEKIETGKNSFKSLPISSINMNSTSIELGDGSFENCSNLQNVKLEASSILKMGEKCFSGDKSIDTNKFELLGTEINIGKNCFTNCLSILFLTLQNSNIINIDDGAFEGCINLESITAHSKSVFHAGLNCFNKLNKLKTVRITSKNVNIRGSCFACCSSLSSFSISGSEDAFIHEKAFEDCRSLYKIDIFASNSFKASTFCFNRATSLKTVNIQSEKIFFGGCCFDKCSSLQQINCPSASEINCIESSFSGCDLKKILKSPSDLDLILKIFKIKSDSNDEYCKIC